VIFEPPEGKKVTAPFEPASASPSKNIADGKAKNSADPDEVAKVSSAALSMILLPRYVVYFQAALLGIVATTFFIFGLMVGSLTSSNSTSTEPVFGCNLAGKVTFVSEGIKQPDSGAVIFVLPKNRRPEERGAANLVAPDEFRPLDNPGLENVARLGGGIVRADEQGQFNLTIDASRKGIEYFVLVVSKHQMRPESTQLTKQQLAFIGTFFLPVDRIITDHKFFWTSITARDTELPLSEIVF
jgi:hypothetical protein